MLSLRTKLMVFPILLLAAAAAAERPPHDLGPAEFYRPPQLTLMTGFIKDPEHKNFTLEQWAREIGKAFDARLLVTRCKQAGFTAIIWYDKWIDGLVFRKTKTTSFTTGRDFLAELAPECKRQGIKLVIYFNTFYDGNPEFARWACLDQRGQPIPFSTSWPLNLLSMHSPFREKALEQVRELFLDYDVDGIWLDVPNYPSISYDQWSRDAFQRQYGKSMEDGSPGERREFALDSIVNWNKEVAAFVRKLKPSAVVTTNGFYDALTTGPRYAAGMAESVDYFSTELHASESQYRLAPILGQLSKPAEAGTLISDDWFTPLASGPLKSSKSPDQMQLELATLFSSGLNVYLALALAHDGTAHEATLQLVNLAGDWLRKRRPYLERSENFCDVGIVLGTSNPKDLYWRGGSDDYSAELQPLEAHLRKSGYLPCRLLNSPHSQRWERVPAGVRTLIVPDRASLAEADADAVLSFVRDGGRLLAFGRGAAGRIGSLFGVRNFGYVEPVFRDSVDLEWNGKLLPLQTKIIHVRPTSAETLLWAATGSEGAMPALTRSGSAYMVTVSEWGLRNSPDVLRFLWQEAIGEPLWKAEDSSGRYFVRLRRQQNRFVLHVMDNLTSTEGPMQRYRPAYTRLHINTRVAPFHKVTVVPDNRPLEVSSSSGWNSFVVYPDPELTAVLE